jgi:hypothetical protein
MTALPDFFSCYIMWIEVIGDIFSPVQFHIRFVPLILGTRELNSVRVGA